MLPSIFGQRMSWTAAGLAACVAAAALSLLVVPFAPVYDAWAWLVWGRELGSLELDTGAGPSWKPLPVFVTALAAPAGDAAPELWVVVARAGWLAAALLAARLGVRLLAPVGVEGRGHAALAAAAAAAGVVLMHDPLTPWLDQFSGALSEPMLAALLLGAVDRDLSGRCGQALWLGFAATLIRPEAWPFLAAYALWVRRRDRGAGPLGIVLVAASPVLWVVPDLIASGSVFTGAERAQAGGSDFLEVLGRAFELAPAALWASSAVAIVAALRIRDARIPVLALGALAWILGVAGAASFEFAGLSRFLVPAGAVVSVLGGVGVAVLAQAAHGRIAFGRRRRTFARAAIVALAVLFVAQGAVRAARFPGQLEDAARLSDSIDTAFGLVDDVGRDHLVACKGQFVTSDLFTQTALAWKLDVGLAGVDLSRVALTESGVAFIGPGAGDAQRLEAAPGEAVTLGARGEWTVYAVGCVAVD
jgi:hypothetical protein